METNKPLLISDEEIQAQFQYEEDVAFVVSVRDRYESLLSDREKTIEEMREENMKMRKMLHEFSIYVRQMNTTSASALYNKTMDFLSRTTPNDTN